MSMFDEIMISHKKIKDLPPYPQAVYVIGEQFVLSQLRRIFNDKVELSNLPIYCFDTVSEFVQWSIIDNGAYDGLFKRRMLSLLYQMSADGVYIQMSEGDHIMVDFSD